MPNIKHEGQQWGDDHGLEIDQFAIDRAEVIKGPGALLYGSDAIGGVLSHTTWRKDMTMLELNLAYQNNLREERSEPVSHGYMPQPENSLERRFNKNTYTQARVLRYGLEAEAKWQFAEHWQAHAEGEYLYARHDIKIPADIDAGDYHFMIRLTDRAGWQQLHAVAIKITE